MIPDILSGGSGSRLWPLSRKQHPKQFLNLLGEHTLLQQTVLRLPEKPFGKPFLVCNHLHRFVVREQLQETTGEAATRLTEREGVRDELHRTFDDRLSTRTETKA